MILLSPAAAYSLQITYEFNRLTDAKKLRDTNALLTQGFEQGRMSVISPTKAFQYESGAPVCGS